MQDLIGVLGLPGAAASLTIAAWAGAKTVFLMRGLNKNGNGNGKSHEAESRGWMKAVLDQHTNAFGELSRAVNESVREASRHSEREMAVWREVIGELKQLRQEHSILLKDFVRKE